MFGICLDCCLVNKHILADGQTTSLSVSVFQKIEITESVCLKLVQIIYHGLHGNIEPQIKRSFNRLNGYCVPNLMKKMLTCDNAILRIEHLSTFAIVLNGDYM